MAQLPKVFKPSEDHSMTIPTDWYISKIVKSEMKKTKAKDGQYLSLGFKITRGQRTGSMLWTNLNLINKNDTAVRIAEAHLEKICAAVGYEDDLEDTEVLHGIEIGIKVTIKPATAQFPEGNEIKDFKDASLVDVEDDDESDSPFDGFGDDSEGEEKEVDPDDIEG